jgi:hypothetical protein
MNPEGKAPSGCPTVRKRLVEESKKEYKKADVAKFAKIASIQEAECYVNRDKKPYIMHPVKPRIRHVKRITPASLERGFDQMGFINL